MRFTNESLTACSVVALQGDLLAVSHFHGTLAKNKSVQCTPSIELCVLKIASVQQKENLYTFIFVIIKTSLTFNIFQELKHLKHLLEKL